MKNVLYSAVFVFSLAAAIWQTSADTSQGISQSPENASVRTVKSAFRFIVGNQSGTCFAVRQPTANGSSRTVLVTAAHTFTKSDAKVAKLVLRKNGTRTEFEFPVRSDDGSPLWKSHPSQDVAAIAVEFPTDPSLAVFDFDQIAKSELFLSEKVTVGSGVMFPCFPAKLESTKLGYPVLRTGTIAGYPIQPAEEFPKFLVDCNAFGGDSGAPVVATVGGEQNQESIIVGMVIGQTRQTDKSVTPFEERIQHTPIGLGIAVNAKFIRETVGFLE